MTTAVQTTWTQEMVDEAGVLLVMARAALDNYIDVVDGEDGPRPNWAMSLTGNIEVSIKALGRYHSVHTGPQQQSVIEADVQQTITLLEEIDTDRHPRLMVLVEAATRIGNLLAGQ